MNDILLNKKISIERCIKQIREYHAMDSRLPFTLDYLKQDAIAMNLQRICEMVIDIANYWIKAKKLGLPQDSGDAFVLLYRAGSIPDEMRKAFQAMVGFRNILVHEYKRLDLAILLDVVEHHLDEPLAFADLALKAMARPSVDN